MFYLAISGKLLVRFLICYHSDKGRQPAPHSVDFSIFLSSAVLLGTVLFQLWEKKKKEKKWEQSFMVQISMARSSGKNELNKLACFSYVRGLKERRK